MSSLTDIKLFPMKFIKESITAYKEKRGKDPKVLVISKEDFLDYILGNTLPTAESLGLETITYGEYLKSGEFDLATAIKKDKDK